MHLPNKIRAGFIEFVTQEVTGRLIFHFHKGVLTKCERVQVEAVSKWEDCAVDHGSLITEDEEQYDYHE